MNQASAFLLLSLAMSASACHGGTPRNEKASQSAQQELPRAALNHCLSDERVVFSCKLQRSTASICALQTSGTAGLRVRYREGLAGEPKLVFSSDSAKPGNLLKRSHLGFAGNTGGYAYSFVGDEGKYIVYSVSGAESLQKAGVVLDPVDTSKQASDRRCESGSLIETNDMKLIKSTLSLPEDPDIKRRGLPELND